ncbi:MAG: HAD-IIIC family phosphatase [Desulfovibrionaceae bacterium]
MMKGTNSEVSLSYFEIQKYLNSSSLSDLPKFNISVLRSIMVEPIEPYLRYGLLEMGNNAVVRFGEYDNIFQEAVGGNAELFTSETNVVLLFMPLETISWKLAREFNSLSSKEINDEVSRLEEYIAAIVTGVRKQTNALILFHGFESPLYPSFGIADAQMLLGQTATIGKLNAAIRHVLVGVSNSFFLDMDICRAKVGAQRFYDRRLWHRARMPYSLDGLAEIVIEELKYVRQLLGKTRKCLVLDCDNTLWGGVVGEDGINGIQLGKMHPGSCFFEFQQEILNLFDRGIILALCSKNNSEDVWEVFENHPDMLLQRNHIAAARINWSDKASNLRAIAADLNIGLDSLVFMDDSEFEINLIRQEIPEVALALLPKNNPSTYREILASGGWFDTLTVSSEDKKRGAMYRAENERKEFKAHATDMEGYYKSLEMVVEIGTADSFSIPRIAQQTQKTNQFNLTTKRYSEAEVTFLAQSRGSEVFYLKLQDRFGDMGIVGTCIVRFDGATAYFDTFLLSCRALGRAIERVFLAQVLRLVRARGAKQAIGEYRATSKNAQVEFFYKDMGFMEQSTQGGQADRLFSYNLDQELFSAPDFFKSISINYKGPHDER